jgi:sigma-B regulation protein RsbU (phosphoserine phosphatase)
VIGLLEQATYQARTLQLQPGAVLAIFTDGVTEAVDETDEEYGEDRLVELLGALRGMPPEVIYHGVIERVRQWQGNLKQHDDITLIVGKVD